MSNWIAAAMVRARRGRGADFIDVFLASDRKVRGLLDQRIATYRTFKALIPGAAVRYNPIQKLTRIDAADSSALREDLLLDD